MVQLQISFFASPEKWHFWLNTKSLDRGVVSYVFGKRHFYGALMLAVYGRPLIYIRLVGLRVCDWTWNNIDLHSDGAFTF